MKRPRLVSSRMTRVVGGVGALVWAFLLLNLLETGGVQGARPWVRVVWIVGLMGSLVSAPILIGSGLGLFSSRVVAAVGDERAPTARQWLAVYFGILGAVSTAALVLHGLA